MAPANVETVNSIDAGKPIHDGACEAGFSVRRRPAEIHREHVEQPREVLQEDGLAGAERARYGSRRSGDRRAKASTNAKDHNCARQQQSRGFRAQDGT